MSRMAIVTVEGQKIGEWDSAGAPKKGDYLALLPPQHADPQRRVTALFRVNEVVHLMGTYAKDNTIFNIGTPIVVVYRADLEEHGGVQELQYIQTIIDGSMKNGG